MQYNSNGLTTRMPVEDNSYSVLSHKMRLVPCRPKNQEIRVVLKRELLITVHLKYNLIGNLFHMFTPPLKKPIILFYIICRFFTSIYYPISPRARRFEIRTKFNSSSISVILKRRSQYSIRPISSWQLPGAYQ